MEQWTPSDDVPLLSTADRGGGITQLQPGGSVGTLTARTVVLLSASVVVWAAASFVLFLSALEPPSLAAVCRVSGQACGVLLSPWSVGVVVAFAVLGCFIGAQIGMIARAESGQRRAASLLSLAPFTVGLAAAAVGSVWISYALVPEPPFSWDRLADSPFIPRELGVILH